MINKVKNFITNNWKWILYVFIILVLVYLIYQNFIVVKKYQEFEKVSKEVEKIKTYREKKETDLDNDGLFDWQEVLYKTDPENPDTDNDGVSDGDEVKNGTNPASVVENYSDVKKIKEVVLDIDSQIARKNKQVVEEKKEVEKFENIKTKTVLTKEDKYFLEEYEKENELIRRDLNKMGIVFKDNFYVFERQNIFLNNFVVSNFSQMIERSKAELKKSNVDFKIKIKKVTSKDIENVEKLISSFDNISKIVNGLDIRSKTMKVYKKEIVNVYGDLSKSISEIKDADGTKTQKDYMNIIKKYSESVVKMSDMHFNLAELRKLRNIKINTTDPGSFFTFGL